VQDMELLDHFPLPQTRSLASGESGVCGFRGGWALVHASGCFGRPDQGCPRRKGGGQRAKRGSPL